MGNRTEQEIKAYWQGVREGVWRYAWWKDGIQEVGTTGTSLKQAYAKIDIEEQKELDLFRG